MPSEVIENDENIPRRMGRPLPVSLPTGVFATAHHLDDQHETMLLKLLRGAYITNLQPVRLYVTVYNFTCNKSDITASWLAYENPLINWIVFEKSIKTFDSHQSVHLMTYARAWRLFLKLR